MVHYQACVDQVQKGNGINVGFGEMACRRHRRRVYAVVFCNASENTSLTL